MLESLEGKRGMVRAKPPIPALDGPVRQADRRQQRADPRHACPTILADGARGVRRARRRPLARHPGLPARPATSPAAASSRRRSASRWASWSTATAAARAPAGRSAPSRSAARSAPTCRSSSSTCRWTTRRSPRPARWSATAASWSSTTPSTWRAGPVRDGVLRRGVVRQVHALPDRLGPRRRGDRPDHRRRGPRRRTSSLLDDLCEVMTDGSLCAMGGLTPMPVRSALRHFPEDFDRPRTPRADDRMPPRHCRRRHAMTLLKEPDSAPRPAPGAPTVERRDRRARRHACPRARR